MSGLGYIYVAVSPVAWPGMIKIGFTRSPRQRLNEMRRLLAKDCRYTAMADGSLFEEHRIHDDLVRYCMGAELYPASEPAVRTVVRRLKGSTPNGCLTEINRAKRKYWRSAHVSTATINNYLSGRSRPKN